MKLYLPIKNGRLGQGFGPEGTFPLMMPLYQSMGLNGHNGYDFGFNACKKTDTMIWSPYYKTNVNLFKCEQIYWDSDINGIVLAVTTEPNEGLGVIVLTEDGDGIFKHIFWHLSETSCKIGQVLKSGDLIGYGGNTGISTGPHLHRGIKPQIKDSNGVLRNQLPNNGYYGAVDPGTHYKNVFIKDVYAEKTGYVALNSGWATDKQTFVNLNFRREPKISNNIIRTLPAGTKIEVLGYAGFSNSYFWLKIKTL